MKWGLLIRLMLCVLTLGVFLYAYINRQNRITQLRLTIPQLGKELEKMASENSRLRFEVDRIENPQHLMELARRPEYRHLKHPVAKEVITLHVD